MNDNNNREYVQEQMEKAYKDAGKGWSGWPSGWGYYDGGW